MILSIPIKSEGAFELPTGTIQRQLDRVSLRFPCRIQQLQAACGYGLVEMKNQIHFGSLDQIDWVIGVLAG